MPELAASIKGSVSAFGLDLVTLTAMSVLGLLLVRGQRVIRRAEGVLLLARRLAYISWLAR